MGSLGQVRDELPSTIPLTTLPLFQPKYGATREETFQLSYQKAAVINQHYGLTANDILHHTTRFWDMHKDGIILRDIGAHVMLSIQYNLVVGLLAQYCSGRPDIQDLSQKVLRFEVSAQFMLTELAHGLDAKNLETTVTMQSDGSFILNTPRPEASKYPPPSQPVAGLPGIAVVMAKLIVEGEDHGIRPVLVVLSDGKEMCKGISSSLLPALGGIQNPWSITSFDHVSLPSTAVLGSLEKPPNMRAQFFNTISRITTGTLAMSLSMIPALKCVTYIAGKYSLRRTVGVQDKMQIPIISFRTQQLPIQHALAQIAVMEPFANQIIAWFTDLSLEAEVRNGLAVILKAVFVEMAQRSIPQLIERCGAQGLFQHNQVYEFDNFVRACAISEGDALVLSIRLAVELCLGKYEMPRETRPDCLLAKYEAGLADEAMAILQSIPEGHRSQQFNRLLIPRCRPIVEGIGNRMAYEIALAAGVDPNLVALYEVGAVRKNLSWYVEAGLLTRGKVDEMENKAIDALEPRLDNMLDQLEIAPYITAPIVEKSTWNAFVSGLDVCRGNGEYPLFENPGNTMRVDAGAKASVAGDELHCLPEESKSYWSDGSNLHDVITPDGGKQWGITRCITPDPATAANGEAYGSGSLGGATEGGSSIAV